MRNLTIRHSLLAVLVFFAGMILIGGVVGVLALGRSLGPVSLAPAPSCGI